VLGSFPKRPRACAGIIAHPPAGIGGQIQSHRSVTKCSRRPIHSSRPKRLYRFCTGAFHKALTSLRRNYRPTPKPHQGVSGGQIPITTKPVPTVGIPTGVPWVAFEDAYGYGFLTPVWLCVLTPRVSTGYYYSQRLPAATCGQCWKDQPGTT
jgi:hypothetical protein